MADTITQKIGTDVGAEIKSRRLENEANTADIALKANSTDVYTKTESDTLLAGKSDTHTHPYASDTHNHDLNYSDISHNHSGVYEPADATILKDADIGINVLAPTGDGSGLTNLPGLQDTAHSFTANGYQELSNGLIIQWGITAAVNERATTTTTFPIAFPNGSLVVSGISYKYVTSAASECSVTSHGATSFVMQAGGGGGGQYRGIRWIAIGY